LGQGSRPSSRAQAHVDDDCQLRHAHATRWAGLGAAYALSSAGAQVTVLETSDSPGGSFVASSPGGRVVEPGIKGVGAQAGKYNCCVHGVFCHWETVQGVCW
jgi:monoamine oxidase